MATAEEVALYYPLPDQAYLQAELERLQADFQAFQDRIAQDQAQGQGTDCICFDDNNHAPGTGDNERRPGGHGSRDDQIPEDNGGDLSAAGLRSALDRLTRRATALLDTQDGWVCPCAERPGAGTDAATGAGVEAVETQAEVEEEDLSSDLFGSNDDDDDDNHNDGDGDDDSDDGDEQEEELVGKGDTNARGAGHTRIVDPLAQIIEELTGGLTNPDIDTSGFDDDDDDVVVDDQEEEEEEGEKTTQGAAAGHGRITNTRGGYIIDRVTGDGTNIDYDTTLTSGLDDSLVDENSVDWSAYEEEAIGRRGDDRSENTGELGEWE